MKIHKLSFFKNLANKAGFSIAELTVALGITGVVALGTMEVSRQINRNQKNLNYDSQRMDMELALDSAFKNAKACLATFNNIDVSGERPLVIKTVRNGAVTNMFAQNDIIGNASGGRMKIYSIASKPIVFSAASKNTGTVDVLMDLREEKGTTTKYLIRKTVHVTIDRSTNYITKCSSLDSDSVTVQNRVCADFSCDTFITSNGIFCFKTKSNGAYAGEILCRSISQSEDVRCPVNKPMRGINKFGCAVCGDPPNPTYVCPTLGAASACDKVCKFQIASSSETVDSKPKKRKKLQALCANPSGKCTTSPPAVDLYDFGVYEE